MFPYKVFSYDYSHCLQPVESELYLDLVQCSPVQVWQIRAPRASRLSVIFPSSVSLDLGKRVHLSTLVVDQDYASVHQKTYELAILHSN